MGELAVRVLENPEGEYPEGEELEMVADQIKEFLSDFGYKAKVNITEPEDEESDYA